MYLGTECDSGWLGSQVGELVLVICGFIIPTTIKFTGNKTHTNRPHFFSLPLLYLPYTSPTGNNVTKETLINHLSVGRGVNVLKQNLQTLDLLNRDYIQIPVMKKPRTVYSNLLFSNLPCSTGTTRSKVIFGLGHCSLDSLFFSVFGLKGWRKLGIR